jgi:hypothetical protein
MATQIQEAQSPKKEETVRERLDRLIQEGLNKIPRRYIQPLFIREDFPRKDIIIGFVGMRGDGKSASGATVALIDYLLEGKPVWSNMAIQCGFKISDSTANEYKLPHGGQALFKSEPLDKRALLNFDPRYHDGCLYIDEVNMEFSEARRFMSNTNLGFNRIGQQIRKFGNALIYTVINEMFIDSRLRELTDIFIRCEDTALSESGLESRKKPGLDFKWIIYPMTGFLKGRERTYQVTHKPLPPVYLKFAPLHSIYDDKQLQMTESFKYGIDMEREDGTTHIDSMTLKPSPVVKRNQWLADLAQDMVEDTRRYIPIREIYNRPDIKRREIDIRKLSYLLKTTCNIPTSRHTIDGRVETCYEIPEERELVPI